MSNFESFEIHDMNKPNDEPLTIHLNELEKQLHLLAAFPYVNGGLFADEEIEIPPFTEEIKDLLL